RAHRPADNLEDEEPMLLDPCAAADPGLLWFDESGQAGPSPLCNDPNGYPYKRAATSIRLYHLNHPGIVDQRTILCLDIRHRVEEADRYFKKYSDGDRTARGAFADAIGDLKRALAESARHSATVTAMLMGLRGTHPVVDAVLAP